MKSAVYFSKIKGFESRPRFWMSKIIGLFHVL